MVPETPQPAAPARLKLAPSVSGPIEVNRLLREIEAVDETLLQLGLRQNGAAQPKLPKTSRLLDELTELNKLNLLQAEQRQQLKQFLSQVKQSAPVLHMSFGADPSPIFVEKLMRWIRQEIHPEALLSVGLQPNIGAGCVVRTTNHYFDFSLRQNFVNKRQLLLDQLSAGHQANAVTTPIVPPAMPATTGSQP